MRFDCIISVLSLLFPLTRLSQTIFPFNFLYTAYGLWRQVEGPSVLSNNDEWSTLLVLHHRGCDWRGSAITLIWKHRSIRTYHLTYPTLTLRIRQLKFLPTRLGERSILLSNSRMAILSTSVLFNLLKGQPKRGTIRPAVFCNRETG